MKLLITDDHKLFIEGIKHLLHDEFKIDDVAVALNGKEAIDKCNREKFDVVLMDINMPVIDGIHATREIKTLHPEIKIIMVSMLADYSSVIKSLKAGADAYILKSEGTEELANALRSILKGEIFLSPTLADIFSKDASGKITTREDVLRFSENLITTREQEILKMICEGFTNEQISKTLNIALRTVDTHRTNMLVKLQLPNTAALVKFAMENKLV